MSDHDERLRPPKKAEPTEADKALLGAQPDWDRMGQIAKRLLNTKPDRQSVGKAVAPKRD